MNPQIIFENKFFLVINKPAGLLVHKSKIKGSELSKEKTLVDWLLVRYPRIKNVGDDQENRPGIVHRLDKDTSGVMLVPKTQDYFLYLKKLFQEHKVKKTYLAIVYGVPKKGEGVISKPIGIKDGTTKRSVHSIKMAKTAETYYKILKTIDFLQRSSASLLEVKPATGRTHQIRIHLASIGHPILGDSLYGNKLSTALSKQLSISRQMLHASSIEFEEKHGNLSRFDTEPAADLATIIS